LIDLEANFQAIAMKMIDSPIIGATDQAGRTINPSFAAFQTIIA